MKNQYFLGVDIGKRIHNATLINQNNKVVEFFKFDNKKEDFENIFKNLPKETKIGMESTGHYYFHFRDYSLAKGFPVKVFNPIETQNLSKTKIRKVKNDRRDSQLIAELTKDKGYFISEDNPDIKELKQLTRFCSKLKSQSRFYKQEISVILEKIFPEIDECFTNKFTASGLSFLKGFFLNNLSNQEMVSLIIKTSRNRIKLERVEKILNLAKDSLGAYQRNETLFLQMKMMIENLENIENQIREVKEKVVEKSKKFKEIDYLNSIKGISEYMAGVILAEIGNIDKFDKKEQLIAFAGLDPSIKQSGNYLRKTGNHISKRGSKHLRSQLYYSAKTASIFDEEMKLYKEKKKEQGKHYNVIMIAIARKMLERVFIVLKQKRPYDELKPDLK